MTPMTQSGHCAFPSTDGKSHANCTKTGCDCKCHPTPQKVDET